MDNTVTLDAGLALQNASTSKQSQERVAESTAVSFAILARISNSARLSDNEKSFLINDVALVDRYAHGSLKKKLLSEITATAIYIEKYASVRKSNPFPPEVNTSTVTTENVAAKVRQSLDTYAKQVDSTSSLDRVVREIPAERVAEYITAPQESNAQPVVDVEDVVDVPLPGARSDAEVVARAIAAAEIDLPLPGAGSYAPAVDVPLIDIETLPSLGESVQVEEVAPVQIPQAAEVRLPGEAAVKQFEMEDLTLPSTIKFA